MKEVHDYVAGVLTELVGLASSEKEAELMIARRLQREGEQPESMVTMVNGLLSVTLVPPTLGTFVVLDSPEGAYLQNHIPRERAA